ncbi:OsmC family protein [Parahaliea mediterranea]|uniref:OsmC family protein n=1 Tax=Parahaliea mediterranea TaxID=651086 RepID=A0A939DIZ6_9GAMM|nr:OsmC family protein [Parahaliea mediterranea]MBN7799133.1 OsmC family protein [Parahaliea mediterranea]
MQGFPHHYAVSARAAESGDVTLSAAGLADIASAPPAEFDGPGDRWSPESLLVAAVADCFVLTFRAIARASKLDWLELSCEAGGELDRVERATQFTALSLKATLRVPAGADTEKAERLLHKAEAGCLITNSLKCPVTLDCEVVQGD